jgi:single-stranded-DNA-specific exonuclease
MIWDKQEIDPSRAREISERYKIDLLDAAILVRRGYTEPEDFLYFLESDPRYLHNPFLFDEMEDAVERILAAREENEKVLVFGDRDVDGITATVLMVQTLEHLGIDVRWRVPVGDEPYGPTRRTVAQAVGDEITLLITVDCGISSVEEVALAAEEGIDTIILDHHNPGEVIPSCTAVINPKIPDSSYPFDGLSGCGVAAKMCWALMFSQTRFYRDPVILLHARPGNETIILEAIRMENMVETGRVTENLVPGLVDLTQTPLGRFIDGMKLVVYDQSIQEKYFREYFGVELGAIDLAPDTARYFPLLSGKSLLSMKASARFARYSEQKTTEIDVLKALFEIYVYRSANEHLDFFRSCLDLVALGTIGDMMPIRNENRILLKQGLDVMNTSCRPSLSRLIARMNIRTPEITSKIVGWQISPTINAAGRMGKPDIAVKMFLSTDMNKAEELAQDLIKLNKDRRDQGEQAWNRILPAAQKSFEELSGRLVLVQDDQAPRGVTGIIAGRLARFFNVPAAVITRVDERAVGSVRSVRGFAATAFLSQFQDVFENWGGHDAAAGFHLSATRLEDFMHRARQAVPGITLEPDGGERHRIDAEIPERYMTPALLDTVKRFEPFGQENPELVFMIRDVVLENIDFIGKGKQKHIKCEIQCGGYRWPAVYWNAAERLDREFGAEDRLDVLFELGVNFFNENRTPQLTIIDVKPLDPAVVS